jgi:ATP-dependent RNA helicase RhlE
MVDLMNRKALNLSRVNALVLDEFDRMLDMGFINDIKKIISVLKNRKQTLLFSATKDKSQKALIDEIAPNGKEFAVSSGSTANQQIEQNLIKVKQTDDKFLLFKDLISQAEFEKVIVFAETKRMVDKLAKKLNQSGIQSSMIHGDKSQNFRTKAIKQFKDGKYKVLIATDVVARGIDINNITHVVNYQTPQTIDSYLHRIGRTGRAGKKGTAYTFVDDIN